MMSAKKLWIERLIAAAICLSALSRVSHASSCAGGYATVCAAGCNYAAVSAAVAAIPGAPLTGDWCVDIRDSSTYNEQVTVQGKNANGFQILIGTTTGNAKPVIQPPANSTAAFQIMNASVTIANVVVHPTNAVPYGISASSAYVTISSVAVVDPSGMIWNAGVSIADDGALSYSSITVKSAVYGLFLSGAMDSVSFSSAQANAGTALYLSAASSASFTMFLASGTGGGAYFNNSSGNAVSRSTFTGGGASLYLNGSSSNTFAFSVMTTLGAYGLFLNTASSNTFNSDYVSGLNGADLANNSSYNIFNGGSYIEYGGNNFGGWSGDSGSSYNQLLSVLITSPGQGMGVGGTGNVISQSTITTNGGGATVCNIGGSSNTFTGDYLFNSSNSGYAASFGPGTTGNVITLSTMIASAAAVFSGSGANRIANSYLQGASPVLVSGSTGALVSGSVLTGIGASAIGLRLYGQSQGLTFSSNTVVAAGSQGTGILIDLNNSGTIVLSQNSVFSGQYGISVSTQAPGTQLWVSSNTIVPGLSAVNNSYGLYLNGLATGATVYGNGIYFRGPPVNIGAQTAYGLYAQSIQGLYFHHNRIDEPGEITGGSYAAAALIASPQTTFKFNDVSSTGTGLTNAYLLQLAGGSTGSVVKDNVFASSFSVSGSSFSLQADLSSQGGFSSDYNDWYAFNGAGAFRWGATAYQGLAAWRATGLDGHSISANPLWSGASAGSEDFHVLSQAGRCTNSPLCTILANDAATSPTIDAGDPAEAFDQEPSPNGGRVNQGSFGDTTDASKSPLPPGSASVAGVFSSSFTSTWTPVASSGYLLQASTAADFSGAVFSSSTANPAAAQLTVTGLTTNTTYYARLAATYGAQDILAGLAPAVVVTLPPAVGGAQIYAVAPTSITVNWIGVSTQAIGYILQASTMPSFSPLFASSATSNTSLSTLTVSNLGVNATFYFQVASLNWSGSPAYAVAGSTYLATPPAAVANLATVASTSSDRQAILAWTAPGGVASLGTASTYNIRYAQAPINPATFASAAAWNAARPVSGPNGSPEQETVAGLTPGVTYYFAVETANQWGNVSGLSNVVSYLAGQDVAPSIVGISPGGGQVVDVSTTIYVTFNAAMAPASFGGFSLSAVADNNGNAINQPVSGTTAFLSSTHTLVFTPTAPLTKNYSYLIAVTTGVKDAAGTPLAVGSSALFATIFDHTIANTIAAGQGATVVVPAGAFPIDGVVAVSSAPQTPSVQSATQKLLAVDSFAHPIRVFNLSATDASANPLEPAVPVTAMFPYSSTVKPGIVDNTDPPVKVATLALWWLDPASQSWVRLPGAAANPQTQLLAAAVPHFSTFALIGGIDYNLDDAFAYPVPYVPSKQSTRVITFQNLSSTANLAIYTVSGALVKTIDANDGSGRATWDARNSNGEDVASGVYLYIISNAQKRKTGKLIIVR